MKRWGWCLPICAALSMSVLPAWAGEAQSSAKDQRAGAKKTFEVGNKLYDSHHFEEALAAFRASYQIVASPNSGLMIARCLRELGRNAEAYREYDAVVAEAGRGGERYRSSGEAATEERGELKSKVALLTVRVADAKSGVTVKVGDVKLADADIGVPVPFNPAQVVVTAESADGASARSDVTLNAGAASEVELWLTKPVEVPAAPPPPTVAPPPVVAEVPSPPSSLRTWSYVAGGVGAAGFITFAVFGAMTASKYSSLEKACPQKQCSADQKDDVDTGKTYQTVANVGLGVGIAGLATGITLFFVSSGHKDDDVHVAFGPGTAQVSGRF
jgi:hypothetical protein